MGEVHEGAVADDVPVLVVDLLEMVDVEGGEGDRPAVAPGAGQLARGVLIEPAAVEQAGERVGARLAAQSLEQNLAPVLEHVRDNGDRGGGHHHVDPAAGVGAGGGQQQQRDRFARADTGDDRDRAGPPEEDRRPQHRQRVEDGAIAGARGRGQRVRDQGHTERSDQCQPPPR